MGERKKFHPKRKAQAKEEDKEEINEISVEPKKPEPVPVKKKFLPSKAPKKPSSGFAAFNRRPRPGPVKFDFNRGKKEQEAKKRKEEEKRRKEEQKAEEERKREEE